MDLSQKCFEQEQELSRLRSELKAARLDISKSAQQQKFFHDMHLHKPSTPKWVTAPVPTEGPGMPVVLLSDLHWGETVNAVEVDGYNSYSVDIARRRLRRVVEKSIMMAELHNNVTMSPGIVVMLGGDMVSGNIHEELLVHNEGSTQEHVLQLSAEIAAALRLYADKFGRVYVPCVHGNHARTTKKPAYRATAVSNYDWQMYAWLQWYFKEIGDDRIVFHIPQGFDVFCSIMGRNYVLTHGDRLGVSGGDGIIGSIGPIMRGAHKVWQEYGKQGRRVDTVVMGHWHVRCDPPGIIVNGTLKGYDGFSKGHRFDVAPPTQAMWWSHPQYGISLRADIHAEDTHARKVKTSFARLS